MPPADSPDPQAGETVELRTDELRRGLPATVEDLREQLPGLEPERRVTDWGRSERIEGLADRVVYEFLYRYWFRVEVEGVENVPAEGAALLLANHSGAVPPDGAMIAKAVKEEHPRARPVHLLTTRRLASVPGIGMVVTKLGRIADHPANVDRLLRDERALVLSFPEGRTGPAKPFKERYRLRPFAATELVQAALRARAPIVPVAVVGAEEALPAIARLNLISRITRLPYVPVAPPIPLPAKFKIRFLESVATDQLADGAWRDQGLARGLTEDIRALIQENLLELVAERRSPWFG